MPKSLAAASIFVGGDAGLLSQAAIHYDGGLITGVESLPTGALAPKTLVIPALVNAHDHGRPSMTSFGASNMPLETWIARSTFGTPPDPYLAAAVSLARSARAGCGVNTL